LGFADGRVTLPHLDARMRDGSKFRGTGSAQAVEHYEIARYGTLIAWAGLLGKTRR
jgi:ferritin-like metal-binding protein YciE